MLVEALAIGLEKLSFNKANHDLIWREAMIKELDAIKRNETWNLVDLLMGVEVVSTKWIYTIKQKLD